MNEIKNNLLKIKKSIPEDVTLVAVSKTKPIKDIITAYETGHRIFGENKIQEMVQKQQQMPNDCIWHMIGHVQTNKVKYMAPFVSLIHAVDSYKLLKEIDKQARKNSRIIHCLLQVKIAEEDSKYGLSEPDVIHLLESNEVKAFQNIHIEGLMGMATYTNDESQIKKEFEKIASFFRTLQLQYSDLKTLSIGMSGDYKTAIDCGSTMIRVGSSIFGARNYS